MERFDALISAIPGVAEVDVWKEKISVTSHDINVLGRVIDLFEIGGLGMQEALGGRVTVGVVGMTCRSCEISLERHLGGVQSVRQASADAGRGQISVSFDGSAPDWNSLAKAVGEAGYSIDERFSSAGKPVRFSLPELAGYLAAAFGIAWLLSASGLSHAAFTADGGLNFWAAMALGLLAGFSSCMAVSGGLMLAVASKTEAKLGSSVFSRMSPSLMFIAGRLVSYAAFGALIGWLGGVIAPSASVSGAIIIAAAAVMLLVGLDSLGILPTALRRLIPTMPKRLGRKAVGLSASGSAVAPLALGAATFFLPCGFTQSLQLYALTVKSPFAGAAILGGFALGTVPALLILGIAAGWLEGRAKKVFLGISGAVLVVLAAVNLMSGLAVLGVVMPWRTSGVEARLEEAGLPPISDGRQVIRMTVTAGSSPYSPDSFTVRAGIPVRWEIDQQSSSGCLSYVVSRELGINEPLKMGSNVVDFTPRDPGEYIFSCSMGMYTGTIIVLPAP